MTMTPQQVQAVKQEYIALSAYYDRPVKMMTIGMYVDDLSLYPFDKVMRALRESRRQKGRRTIPLPVDIIDLIEPDQGSLTAQALAIAGRITEATGKYGYTNAGPAEAFIGPLGWRVVARKGGWTQICQSLLVRDAGTFFAQCRDLARAELELSPQAAEPTGRVDATRLLQDKLGVRLPSGPGLQRAV